MFNDWQTWAAFAIVAGAAIYLGRSLVRKMTGKAQSGCASCPNNASKSAASGRSEAKVLPLVQIGEPSQEKVASESAADEHSHSYPS